MEKLNRYRLDRPVDAGLSWSEQCEHVTQKIDLEMEDSFIMLVVLFTLKVVISLDVPTLSLPSFIQEGQELSFKCRYRIQESKIPEVDIKV